MKNLLVTLLSLLLNSVPSSTSLRKQPTPPDDPNWSRPYLIMILADPQIGWNKPDYNSEKLLKEASKHVKRIQPEFLLIAGDLIQKSGNEEEYLKSKSIIDDMEIPYYVISGNHDVGSIPTIDKLNEFQEWWNGHTLEYWYSFEYYDTLFCMMESDLLRARDLLEAGEERSDEMEELIELAEAQVKWLADTLEEAYFSKKYTHAIPIFHHPFATKDLDEDNSNKNIPEDMRDELLDILRQYSEDEQHWISHVFSGHYHKNARVFDKKSDIEFRTYASTGVILGGKDDSGLAIVKISKGSIEEKYLGYDDIPRSRSSFEMDNASFEITSPINQQIMMRNDEINIQWNSSSNSQYVKIFVVIVTNASDEESKLELSSQTDNSGYYKWRNISDVSSNDMKEMKVKFRIESFWDSNVSGESEEWIPIQII